MLKILLFLIKFDSYVFLAMFGVLALVALVNFLRNPYLRQNGKLKVFCKKVVAKPGSLTLNVKLLPIDYQRQWRAFINSGAKKPSAVFEFVKKPFVYKLWFLHFVAMVISISYTVLAFMLKSHNSYLAVQIAFALASLLVVLLSKFIYEINLAHARKCFGKFVCNLTTVVEVNKSSKAVTTQIDTASQLDALQNQPPQTVIDKAVQALRQKGLENPRTVEEQRKLNVALNNLLQVCSKKK